MHKQNHFETEGSHLNEFLPFWFLIQLGQSEYEKGWTLRHCAKYWNSSSLAGAKVRPGVSAMTHAIGRQTDSDLASGFGGGLSTRQCKDHWSRFGSSMPSSNMDNYRGVACG